MTRHHFLQLSLLVSSMFVAACAGVNELHINSQPTGAKLFVNEKYVGQTPKEVPGNWTLAGGETMHLTLEKEGYRTRKEIITHADFDRMMGAGEWQPFNSKYGLGSRFDFSYPLEPMGSTAPARAPIVRRSGPPQRSSQSAPRQKPSESWR